MDTFTPFDDMTTLLVSSLSAQRDVSSSEVDVPVDSEHNVGIAPPQCVIL